MCVLIEVHGHLTRGFVTVFLRKHALVLNRFYCCDDISWQSHNKEDASISRNENGEKEYIHNVFLL